GLLTAEERAEVEAHLAECAWCQNQLATYDVVDAALRRQFAGEAVASSFAALGAESRGRARPALTLEEIMQASNQRPPTTPPTTPPTPMRRLNSRLTMLGAIAAALVVAVLAASLFAYFSSHNPGPVAHPTPTLDPQTQAYLDVLTKYYTPLGVDMSR